MKRFSLKMLAVITAILLIILSVTAWAADNEGLTAWVICHPASYVNARSSPSGRSQSIGRFEAGDKVEIDGRYKNGFAHSEALQFELGEGWIAAGYLVFDEPVWEGGKWYYVCSNGRVASRKCIDGDRLCWLQPMTELQVFWRSDEWCLTTRGMVKTKYLEEDPCHK